MLKRISEFVNEYGLDDHMPLYTGIAPLFYCLLFVSCYRPQAWAGGI